ncbi:MAG: hypothetical protein ACREBR_02605, partial [bacterium]
MWETIYDADLIYEKLITRNISHFKQAEETPFASGQLADKIGNTGSGIVVDQILNGTFQHQHELLPETNKFIEGLAAKKEVAEGHHIPVTFTSNEFRKSTDKIRENTGSSPSGRHVGHYKAAVSHPHLNWIHATMAQLPAQYGFAPLRWQHAIDKMLEKSPGVSKITRLRIIQLLEYDFNFVMKLIIGRRLMWFAQGKGYLRDEQYGSRPGRTASSPVLNKALTYDIIRQTKTVAATFDNDAVGCYDRLVSSPTVIACRSMGLPKSFAEMHCAVWKSMSHQVRTGHGLSRRYNGGDSILHGTGQGNGGSCGFWTVNFNVMVEQLDKHHIGMQLYHPDGSSSRRTADGYVDDTSTGVTSRYRGEDREAALVTQDMKSLAQSWERLLFSSGGKLALHKCFWYLMHWNWDDGTPILINDREDQERIALTSGLSSEEAEIPRLTPSESHRTLGVRITPNGDWKTEQMHLKNIASNIGKKILTSSLTPIQAYIAFKCVYRPKIEFSSPVVCLTEGEANDIQRPVLNAVLAKTGMNRNMPRAVIFGPHELGGLNWPNLYTEIGINHLKYLIGHIRMGDVTGKLMEISLAHLQLRTGSGRPALTAPIADYTYALEGTWIEWVWSFTSEMNASIELTDGWVPEL